MPPAPASLYRRHRPRTFADVVGQEHVVRTLSNAIEQGKVHHAYLFVGSRGTGKTSMAKILAASLNCQGEAGGGAGSGGPTTTPCGACDSCRSIAAATSLDVIEMDAASNNSVDDIRDLREKVAFAPVSGRHKVYILDEAHMLSTAAWNAFLKTLEEPPPNTIFVLATTEAAKVLPTVVDRCHRFDFARPTVAQIAGVLARVADAEGIEIGDEARALIARSATGSFRDALGTLEQLLAYSGPTVALEDVLAVLGAADADLLFGTVDAVSEGDAREALLAADRLAGSGRDVGRFFGDLEAHLRGLMILQAIGSEDVPEELRVSPDQDVRLLEQAARVGPAEVVRLLDLLAAGLRAMKDGADPRTQLELALIKAATPELEPSVKALLARVERLEGGGSATRAPAARAPEVPATAAGRAAAAASAPAERPAPAGRTAVAVTAEVEGQPPVLAATTVPGASEAGPEAAAQVVEEAAAAVAADLETEGAPPPAVAAVAIVDPAATNAETGLSVGVELDLDTLGELWPAVLERIEAESPLLAAALRESRPTGLADSELTLAWAKSEALSRRKAENAASRELIAKTIRSVTGSSLRVAYALRADGDAPVQAAMLSEDELIDRLVNEFDAEELLPEPEPEPASDPPPQEP